MADRRRRKCPTDDNSDINSDESGEELGSDCENSEYESVDDEDLEDEEEGDISIDQKDKSLDHDEDRKNPQYIPKRGNFYEHDDRLTEGEEKIPETVPEKSAPQEKETKKKVWKEDDKWTHDRFAMYDQAPKSKEELVATYGYDIRNEEVAPRARRRRRYGRGPNKYTRNWEDLDAYAKSTRGRDAIRGGGKRKPFRRRLNGEEEFPPLPDKMMLRENIGTGEEEEQALEHQQPQSPVDTAYAETVTIKNNANLVHDMSENHKSYRGPPKSSRGGYVEDRRREDGGRGKRDRRGSRRPGRGAPKGYQERNYNYEEEEHYGSRNRGDAPRGRGEPKGRGLPSRGGHTQTFSPGQQQQKELHAIAEEIKSMTITPSHKEEHHYKRGIDNRRSTIPPRLQETMRGNKTQSHSSGDPTTVSKPKRYSSQRQRPLQEPMGQQYHAPQSYYEQNASEPNYPNKLYESSNSSPGVVPPSPHSLAGPAPPSFVPPVFTTSAPSFPPAPRLFTPVTQPHLIGPPVAGPPLGAPRVPGPPVPGAVGGAPVTGPPFLPPENMMNYAAGAPALVAAPPQQQFPPFQAFTPVTQPPPQEIYSNGVMYYNTESQQHLPRFNPVLQKRPKAAIPIVPPPDRQLRGLQSNDMREMEQQQEYHGAYDHCNTEQNEPRFTSFQSDSGQFIVENCATDRLKEEVVSGSEEVYESAPSEDGQEFQDTASVEGSISGYMDESSSVRTTSVDPTFSVDDRHEDDKKELPLETNAEGQVELNKYDEERKIVETSLNVKNEFQTSIEVDELKRDIEVTKQLGTDVEVKPCGNSEGELQKSVVGESESEITMIVGKQLEELDTNVDLKKEMDQSVGVEKGFEGSVLVGETFLTSKEVDELKKDMVVGTGLDACVERARELDSSAKIENAFDSSMEAGRRLESNIEANDELERTVAVGKELENSVEVAKELVSGVVVSNELKTNLEEKSNLGTYVDEGNIVNNSAEVRHESETSTDVRQEPETSADVRQEPETSADVRQESETSVRVEAAVENAKPSLNEEVNGEMQEIGSVIEENTNSKNEIELTETKPNLDINTSRTTPDIDLVNSPGVACDSSTIIT